jgi:hypothetical protein
MPLPGCGDTQDEPPQEEADADSKNDPEESILKRARRQFV